MSAPAFTVSAFPGVAPNASRTSTCTFVARPSLMPAVRARRASLTMQTEQPKYDNDDSDCGDGFIGEADMDDMLGVAMPDNLAGFEKREIMNSNSREELVDKLKEIASRRKDILQDRRRGMGIENVGDYLNNL